MKLWKKRAISAVMAAAMAIVALSGCGNKQESANDDDIVITVSGFIPSEEAEPEKYEQVMKQIEEFEALHPNIKIKESDWRFSNDTYIAMAEAKTMPTAYVVPLTETERIKDLGYAADLSGEFNKRGYTEWLTEEGMQAVGRDGKIYFMPTWTNYFTILVNIGLYKQAGLVADDGTLYQPTDWEDLARVAKEIKDKTGVPGFVVPAIGNQGGWRTMCMAWSYGVDFMEKDENGKWKATFDTPEYAEVFKLISKMRWEDNSLPATTMIDYSVPMQMMAANEVGMTFGDYDYVNNIMSTYHMDKDNLGVLRIPSGPKRNVSLVCGDIYAVDGNATPEQISACLDFFEFIGMGPVLNDTVKKNMDAAMERDAQTKMIGPGFRSLWKDDAPSVKYKRELIEKNLNVNPKNIEQGNNLDGLEFQAEEPVAAQALYTAIDAIIQEVLNNKDADIEKLISDTAEMFQKNQLDTAE